MDETKGFILSNEERESIINAAVEKTMLSIPGVIGNLLQEKVAMRKLAEKFYTENPDFKENKNIVGAIIQQIETENPADTYSEILKKATPKIKNAIISVNNAELKSADKPIQGRIGESDFGKLL